MVRRGRTHIPGRRIAPFERRARDDYGPRTELHHALLNWSLYVFLEEYLPVKS